MDNIRETVSHAVHEFERHGRFCTEKQFMQHGSVTIYDHSIRVALVSLRLAGYHHLSVDKTAMVRGALLHDYFLYDWHDPHNGHLFHCVSHPFTALKNAKNDFNISKVEEDIISRHMFPLVPVPPKYKESWVVCMADKYCAVCETVRPYTEFVRRNLTLWT